MALPDLAIPASKAELLQMLPEFTAASIRAAAQAQASS